MNLSQFININVVNEIMSTDTNFTEQNIMNLCRFKSGHLKLCHNNISDIFPGKKVK